MNAMLDGRNGRAMIPDSGLLRLILEGQPSPLGCRYLFTGQRRTQMDSNVSAFDSLGRSDLVGSYHASDYNRSDVKHEQRIAVMDFIAGFSSQNDCVKMLTMPGIGWEFERLMLTQRPKAQFVGLEHSYSAFMRARRGLPGLTQSTDDSFCCLQDRVMGFGHGNYTYARVSREGPKEYRDKKGKVKQWSGKKGRRSNRLLFMSVDTFLSVFLTNYNPTREQMVDFHQRFYSRTAAWIDFTSQLCATTENCIRNAHMCMNANGIEKPVVFTLMNARDRFHGDEERVRRIQELQPAFNYRKHWTYVGKGNVSMLTICGTII